MLQAARDTACLSKFIPRVWQLRYQGFIIGVTLDAAVLLQGEEKREGGVGGRDFMCTGIKVSLTSFRLSGV